MSILKIFRFDVCRSRGLGFTTADFSALQTWLDVGTKWTARVPVVAKQCLVRERSTFFFFTMNFEREKVTRRDKSPGGSKWQAV